MARVKVNVFLSQNSDTIIDLKIYGILSDDSLRYVHDGIINIFDFNSCILKRYNGDYNLLLDFKNLIALYSFDGYEMKMNIKLIDKNISNKSVFIKYCILETNDIFEYQVGFE